MVAFMGAILAVFEEFTCLKGGDACGPIGILCSSSCSNQFLSILSNLLFCLSFLLNFGVKILARRVGQLPLFSSSSSSPSASSSSSCLFIIITAVVNGSLAMVHIGISIWMLEEKLRGGIGFSSSTSWQVLLSHGLVLIMVTLVASMNKRLIGASFSIIWSAALISFALFFCISSVLDFIVKRELQIMLFLDSFSLIGAVLLLLIVFKSSNTLDGLNSSDSALYEALDSESNDNIFDSDDFVTPLAKAGIFSKITFRWLNPLMKKGYQKPLDEQDIPHLTEEDRAESCYFLFMEQLNKQKQKHASPSFLWAIFCCHSNQIFVSGFFAFLKVITVSSGPILLKSFIKVSQGGGTFRYEGFVLAIAMYLAKALESISQRLSVFLSKRIGLQVRSLLSAAIYQKQLCLSNLAKLAHSSGEIMNYLTVDAYRIGELSNSLHQTWSTCLQICIALLIMYDAVGLATIAAMGVIIFSVICNAPLAKLQHKFQTKLLESQDKRLKAVSEALVNMKVLKLYAWETHFQKVIESLREVEYKWLKAFQLRRGYNSFLFWSSPVLVSAATFSTCYLLSIPLNAGNVFTFVATLRIIQAPIRQIPDVIGVFIQAKVSFARIIKFLHAPELQIARVRKNISADCKDPVIIKAASFSWDEHYCKSTLSDINLQISAGEKVAICGEVGSGKSTLLAAVLGEIPNTKGLVRICGTIAYVSQNAWIQSGTIRENILFGLPMEEKKYHDTLQKCSLLKDIQMLPFGDLTEIGERGVNLSGGQKQRVQLARALYQDADIYLLDDPFSAVDAHTASSLFNEYVLCGLSTKTVLLVTHQVDFLPVFDSVVLMGDGKVLCTSHYHELLASSKEFQDLVNAHKDTVGSERLDQLVSGKRKKTSRREISSDVSTKSPKVGKCAEVDELIKKEEREIGDTRLKPYIQYLTQNKGFLYFSLAALSHGLFAGGQVLQNSWMASNVDKSEVSLSKLIAVYLAIGFGTMFFLLLRAILTVVLGIVTSRSLFAQLIKSVFRAPMSFFDSTPLGRILTRASFDLNIVDLDVPIALVFSLNATVNAYSNLGVLSFVTWQVSFVSVALVYFALWLQRYYLASARDLMRLNGTTKSMVASHLAESLAGATTIRAFGEERRFFAKNLKLINNNASPYFHNIAANEWLILRLETMSAAILSSSALVMVLLPSGTFSPGFIGMALSYGLSLNLSLVASIQKQCELANCIISVERLNQYMHIPSEAPEVIESNRPSPSWPAIGTVELHELQVRYRPDAPLVLQGISCTFKGGHKIGIVGRTGSGKTTLIGALFRLVELTGGRITVDGVDISTIGLHDLRSRFGIIPQDPALFNGSVRYNLDPLGQYTDQQIWQVLDKCQLRGAVEEKEGGLDSLVVEDGSNWSMGQRQLFCLGRALLKRSRLLFLDEATASIDNATDAILQKTINTEFEGCTIIVVAHRIPTVMDSTMVLAISDGKLMEYDEPMKLIKTEGSLFGELVKEYWSQSSSSSTLV